VLGGDSGQPEVIVPHRTIAALQEATVPRPGRWSAEAGAFDLWLPLMAGATAVLADVAGVAAA
jgi:hypothetical protein